MHNLTDEDERPNARRDALLEAMAHLSSAHGILVPLMILEEQRDRKAEYRAARAHKDALPADDRKSA